MLSNSDGSWWHCENSGNLALRSLRVPKDALWSLQFTSVIPTYLRPSISWVRFRLCLHRWRSYCQLKSRRAQALFTASISASRSVRSHRESLRSATLFRQELISSAISSTITVFTSDGEDQIYCGLPVPKSFKGLSRCLGMVTYYCWFISNCAQILHSLSDLLMCSPEHLLWNPKLKWFSPPWNNIYLTRLSWDNSALQPKHR